MGVMSYLGQGGLRSLSARLVMQLSSFLRQLFSHFRSWPHACIPWWPKHAIIPASCTEELCYNEVRFFNATTCFFSIQLYWTVWYYIVLYCTVLYFTVLHGIILHCIVLHCIVLSVHHVSFWSECKYIWQLYLITGFSEIITVTAHNSFSWKCPGRAPGSLHVICM